MIALICEYEEILKTGEDSGYRYESYFSNFFPWNTEFPSVYMSSSRKSFDWHKVYLRDWGSQSKSWNPAKSNWADWIVIIVLTLWSVSTGDIWFAWSFSLEVGGMRHQQLSILSCLTTVWLVPCPKKDKEWFLV